MKPELAGCFSTALCSVGVCLWETIWEIPAKDSHQKHNVSNPSRLSRKNSPFHFGASGESQKEAELQKILKRQIS